MGCELARLENDGQLTLPKSVRDELNLDNGSCIAFYLEGDQIVIKKVNPRENHVQNETPVWGMMDMFCKGREKKDDSRAKPTIFSGGEASNWKPSL